MGDKDQQKKSAVNTGEKTGKQRGEKPADKVEAKSREDRLAEALRANLRRRKSASKSRDAD
ncbi:hypothetical protein V1T76_00615 [Roseibium sp. FZY0029]|uniref:hypothetical protein n=1 Tax=Roseibium sp. FZY0029 TaxID=3116647 RepID=UPI002EADFB9D|nr:hypothetical protein [Roseibium sp. FZY0029]